METQHRCIIPWLEGLPMVRAHFPTSNSKLKKEKKHQHMILTCIQSIDFYFQS